MKFETSRLILREYRQDDFSFLYEIFSDAETMKHYPHPFSKEETINWINRNIARYREYGFGLWAVELKENNQFIGDCGITMQNIHGNLKPEIGYHINKKYQRCGYATEASAICIKYAFKELHFPEIYSYMKYTNKPSQCTAIKNGMHFIEEYEDEVNKITRVYAITYDEWKQRNNNL